MDPQSIRHLHALRNFIRNLVEQAERSGGCECHRPPSLLLVGPPGVGKTFLVKQMSNVCEMPLFGVHTHQLTSPTALYNLFCQARELDYPSLFFLDDIDFIFSNHDKDPGHNPLVEALRQELYKQLGTRKLKIFDPSSLHNPVKDPLRDSTPSRTTTAGDDEPPDNNGLIVVAATSSPWLLYKDHELLSRFRGVYLVGLPDKETRFHLLKSLLQKVQHNLTDKEILLVAEKTEGYTPSDLMVVIKNLNYKQFAFLFSMAGVTGFQESSGNESMSSSEMTESDTETESNEDEDVNEDSAEQLSDGKSSTRSSRENIATPVASSISSGKNSSCSNNSDSEKDVDDTLTQLEKDWGSDEEEVKVGRKDTAFSSTPKKDSINKISALVAAASIPAASPIPESHDQTRHIEVEDKNAVKSVLNDEELNMITKALNDLDEACNSESLKEGSSTNCDNRNNNEHVNDLLTADHDSTLTNTREVSTDDNKDFSIDISRENPVSSVGNLHKEEDEDIKNDEAKTIEFHLYGPPDPMRNDNEAIDSDSDNEDSNQFNRRTRRVNFSDSMTMSPLTVEVNHMPINNTIDYDNSASISTTLVNKLLNNGSYDDCGASNNILKRLLSSSVREGEEDPNKDNSESKEHGTLNEKIGHHVENMMGVYSQIERNDDQNVDVENLCRKLMNAKVENQSRFRRSLSPGGSDRVTDGRRSVSVGGSPVGSDMSSHMTTENCSDGGKPTQNVDMASRDSEINKTHDSDSPTIPSSEVSTETCNISGETLECHSDSDERFRNLEEDLKTRREKDNVSEGEASSEGNETSDALHAFLNLSNFGDVGIKIITVEDVLNVISRTKRSVSDEEIKRYTDFMVWFAKVAKSACPHNSRGSTSDSTSVLNESLMSTKDTPQLTRKRKGPLHKLGRFLLKALMLLLD